MATVDAVTRLRAQQKKGVRYTLLVLMLVVLFGFTAAFRALYSAQPKLEEVLAANNALQYETPRALSNVRLVDHHGEEFSIEQWHGQWDLVIFAYTYCPDVCPINLADLNLAHQQLADLGLTDRVRFWMVTVDPDRDTVAQLANYVPFFNNSFTGLTGDLDHITMLASQLSNVFFKEGQGEGYTVAHSENYAIIDPQGHFVALLRPPQQPTSIRRVLEALIQG